MSMAPRSNWATPTVTTVNTIRAKNVPKVYLKEMM
jgi:hypothetical protein